MLTMLIGTVRRVPLRAAGVCTGSEGLMRSVEHAAAQGRIHSGVVVAKIDGVGAGPRLSPSGWEPRFAYQVHHAPRVARLARLRSRVQPRYPRRQMQCRYHPGHDPTREPVLHHAHQPVHDHPAAIYSLGSVGEVHPRWLARMGAVALMQALFRHIGGCWRLIGHRLASRCDVARPPS